MDAAKIFAVAAPTAVEAHAPVSRQRQSDVVAVEVLVAEIYNHQSVVARAALVPAMIADDAVVLGIV